MVKFFRDHIESIGWNISHRKCDIKWLVIGLDWTGSIFSEPIQFRQLWINLSGSWPVHKLSNQLIQIGLDLTIIWFVGSQSTRSIRSNFNNYIWNTNGSCDPNRWFQNNDNMRCFYTRTSKFQSHYYYTKERPIHSPIKNKKTFPPLSYGPFLHYIYEHKMLSIYPPETIEEHSVIEIASFQTLARHRQ